MPKEDIKLPPPGRGGRTKPDMMGEDPGIYNRLSSLAEAQGGGMGGMGGGGVQEAAQMVMSGASQLLQAAKMHPALEPIVMQALSILRAGVAQLGGGGGEETGMEGEMGGEEPRPKQRRRTRPPRGESEAVGGAEEMPY